VEELEENYIEVIRLEDPVMTKDCLKGTVEAQYLKMEWNVFFIKSSVFVEKVPVKLLRKWKMLDRSKLQLDGL